MGYTFRAYFRFIKHHYSALVFSEFFPSCLKNFSTLPYLSLLPLSCLCGFFFKPNPFVLSEPINSLNSYFIQQYSRLCNKNHPKEWILSTSQYVDPSDLNTWKTEKYAERVAIQQINANPLLEDRAVVSEIQTSQNGSLLCAAVIDGHGGWQVAEYVQRYLPGFIQECIHIAAQRKKEAQQQEAPLTNQEIGQAMRDAFLKLDEALFHKIKGSAQLGFTQGLQIGACCTCVVITPDAVITANVGDCRIVMSNMYGQSRWLTTPHSANEPSEQKKLRLEHPKESNIVVCKYTFGIPLKSLGCLDPALQWLSFLRFMVRGRKCYVKGRLQPTRAFGDFYLKHSDFAFDYQTNSPLVREAKSFPYITASPDIKIYNRLPRKVCKTSSAHPFILLGSDGVWDFLSLKDVTKIVSEQLCHGVDKACCRFYRIE